MQAPMVHLQSLEGKVSVKATSGAVKLKSIKGGKLDVESTTGNIEASSILGDVNITTTKVRAWAQRPIPCIVYHEKQQISSLLRRTSACHTLASLVSATF
jgi:hypothetical protein